jgi:hypothetical protein
VWTVGAVGHGAAHPAPMSAVAITPARTKTRGRKQLLPGTWPVGEPEDHPVQSRAVLFRLPMLLRARNYPYLLADPPQRRWRRFRQHSTGLSVDYPFVKTVDDRGSGPPDRCFRTDDRHAVQRR